MENYPPSGRPAQRTAKTAPAAAAPSPAPVAPAPKSRAKGILWSVIALLVVAALGLAAWCYMKPGEIALVNKAQYQTVFLTNGQVYFGKIESIDKDYLRLTKIYYLQVQQSVQPTDGKTNTEQNANNSQTQLVKLGNELHGPEDSMQINRSQVLFWENIKQDGKVAQAISKDANK